METAIRAGHEQCFHQMLVNRSFLDRTRLRRPSCLLINSFQGRNATCIVEIKSFIFCFFYFLVISAPVCKMYHFAVSPAIWLQGKPFPRIPSVGRVKKLQSKQLDCGILSLLVKMNTTNAAFNRRSGADGRFMFCMFCLPWICMQPASDPSYYRDKHHWLAKSDWADKKCCLILSAKWCISVILPSLLLQDEFLHIYNNSSKHVLIKSPRIASRHRAKSSTGTEKHLRQRGGGGAERHFWSFNTDFSFRGKTETWPFYNTQQP